MTQSSHPVNPGYYESWRRPSGNCSLSRRYFGADEIRLQIEVLDSRTPALGAKVVARAWTDPAFKERLLANGRAACDGFSASAFYDDTQLIVLENTETVHNLIVCTLCSAT